jgi:hypothetical protein
MLGSRRRCFASSFSAGTHSAWSRFSALALLAALPLMGCGRTAVVAADGLPLRRVVVYRNGVGYFERAGHVEESEVRFKMKETEVGDFLATLAVMEKGGSSVRAAAFPLDVDDDRDADDGDGDGGGGAKKKKPKTEDERRGLKKVVLSLDGRAHDLEVGYIAESPVWRPSYRLVVREGGEADLQAWGIVQNLSGEDWRDVQLSLVAGAPLAFEAQLGVPVIPTRPTVTDEGEVIAAVPRAETSLAQQPSPAPMAPGAPAAQASAALDEEADAPAADAAPRAKGHGGAAGSARKTASNAPAPPPPPPAAVMPAHGAEMPRREIFAPRDLRSLAAVAVEAGATRYDLPQTVTVPDKSATMVMLLSRKVPGEANFLFAPDGGVPDSVKHPFRVARFANKTGGALERGPIAVFEQGSFLGQGMVDPLPDGATATVPFALERGIAVDLERKYDELAERVAKIENSELTIERDAVARTLYRLRNGGEAAAKILVKHPRMNGTRLFNAPKGTEDNVGTLSALVPSLVGPRSTGELVVEERSTIRRGQDWFSPIADSAIKAYFADPKGDREVKAKLQAAWGMRAEILTKQDARLKIMQEQADLGRQTEETRRNLKAIEKNKSAEALRAKLTARLGEMATRLDDLTKQQVEIDAKLAELRVQFKETIREIKIETAPPT